MRDLSPHRPIVDVNPRIWHDHPEVAAAILGYCEGRLGLPASPPRTGKQEYMREYLIGAAITEKGNKNA